MIAQKTAYDIVILALRTLGVAALGDSIAADVAQEALTVLNSIRAGLSGGLKNNVIFDETFQSPGNVASVSLGVGGDIAIRPARIDQVTLISGTPGVGVVYQLDLRSYEEYRELPLTNTFAMPTAAYIDTAYPQQHIWFYPGLSASWYIRVNGLAYMAEYESLSDIMVDPPEWFEVMYKTLALNLAPMYGVDLSGTGVLQQVNSANKHIKANMFNARLRNMPNGLTGGGRGRFNFFAGR